MSIGPVRVVAIATTAMALIVGGAARADWLHDDYFSVGAGINMPNRHLAFTTSKPDWGWFGALDIGGRFAPSWRAEVELDRRSNKIPERVAFSNDINGHFAVNSILTNVLWDWNPRGIFNPYIGAGIGFALATAKGGHVPGSAWNIDDAGFGYAAQAIAGFGWRLSQSATLDFQYRYVGTTGIAIKDPIKERRQHFNAGVLMAGFRFQVGHEAPVASPPPPPPPPPMAPATSMLGPFKVYFQWDKSNLTKEAMATVDEVADQVKNKKIKTVHIEGDTDTSGSDAYNQALSDARSAAVRDRLIADGVPASAIDTVGLGETNPAVKTGDAVKEPLNRRAEITITILNQ